MKIGWLWEGEEEKDVQAATLFNRGPSLKCQSSRHYNLTELEIPLAQYLIEHGDRKIQGVYIALYGKVDRYFIKDIRLGRYCDQTGESR